MMEKVNAHDRAAWPNDRTAVVNEKLAFPAQRKEPLEYASHVRNAVARFNQVEGVSATAEKFGVALRATN
jgi:hypothetical protein